MSDFEESESEIGDFENEERNQQLLVTSQISITLVNPVDGETLLDDGLKKKIFLHEFKNEVVVLFVGTKRIAIENIKIPIL